MIDDIQTIVGERYGVVRLIGSGGLGVVWEAVDTVLGRRVAIKRLAAAAAAASSSARARLVREARAMARVSGQHVLTIYDCILGADGVPLLIMELIDGSSLSGWLVSGQPLAMPVAIEITRQMADGLATIHSAGLVHRDVKPSNVLVDTGRQRILISDFGLTRNWEADAGTDKGETTPTVPGGVGASSELTGLSVFDHRTAFDSVTVEAVFSGVSDPFVGTPAYLAPEAVQGKAIDPRTDLYALGRVFYELLTGRHPFTSTDVMALLREAITAQPPAPEQHNPAVPAALSDIVVKLLQPDPDRRFQGAEQLQNALNKAVSSLNHTSPNPAFADWIQAGKPALAPGEGSTDIPITAEAPDPGALFTTRSLQWRPSDDTIEDAPLPHAWLWMLSEPRGKFVLGDNTIFGRSRTCDVVIESDAASQRHFSIERVDGGYYLQDLGSRNGTVVNGAPVTGRLALHDHDEISVGNTRMLFVHIGSSEHETAARQRLRQLAELWQQRLAPTSPGQPFAPGHWAHELGTGLMREALGYRVERAITPYRGIAGFIVEAPMMWIRQTRFPLLFVPVTETLALDHIIHQLQHAAMADYLAVLIAVPPGPNSGYEAAALRQLVADSLYRYDLAVLDFGDLEHIIRQNDSRTLVQTLIDKGIELSRLSPYVVRGPVPDNMFFGREAELKTLSQTLANHAVIGGRRMGKSSIFLRLYRLLNGDPRFCAHYVNCEACFDYNDFLATCNAALDTDTATEPNRPRLTGMAMLRSELTRLSNSHGQQHTIFLLDEVDELVSFDSRADTPGRLFKTLRALSHEQICHFIFSGGRTLRDALHDAHSPFFNFCDQMRLYPLCRRNVAEIIVNPMRQLSIVLDDEQTIIDRVVDITSGHPNVVQFLCHRLVLRSQERCISPAMVEEVIHSDEFVRHFMETAWSQATALEKLITLVPDRIRFTRSWLQNRLAQLGFTDQRALDSALATLELYALLRVDGDDIDFVLQYFPTAARSGDVAALIAIQVAELKDRGCLSSTAR